MFWGLEIVCSQDGACIVANAAIFILASDTIYFLYQCFITVTKKGQGYALCQRILTEQDLDTDSLVICNVEKLSITPRGKLSW